MVAAGVRWHVQVRGAGPPLLLLHGTGASSHSWAPLLTLLARRFTVVAPDLPGHAFSSALPGAPSLPALAAAVAQLLQALRVEPALALGHSAGAAILLRLAADRALAARVVLGVNAALLPFAGPCGALFAPLAKLLALNPLVPRLFAWQAGSEAAVRRLLDSTGSRIDAVSFGFYARLLRQPAHVAGALSMMANWDLAPLQRDLPRVALPVWLIVGLADRTVPPAQADAVAARLPAARVVRLPGLGHLAHEENPPAVARIVLRAARAVAVLPSASRRPAAPDAAGADGDR
ncbi:MAG: alpha/beta fold hydrolase [Burkholderiaceae bacterium]|nr:alpha/beta fold hydrolase [Burkholderiaceae bacterium]